MSNTTNVKRAEVAALMDQLRADVTQKQLSPKEELAILERLKVHGRTVTGSDAIYSSEGIVFLAQIAFRSDGISDSSREALRCLANALFLDRKTVQYFIDAGFVEKASEAYKSENVDDEFLLARILFFSTTFAPSDDLVNKWASDHHLVDHNLAAISRHTKSYASPPVSMMSTMALQDTLKLLYTLTTKLSSPSTSLSPAVPDLLTLLSSIPLQSPPLQAPTHNILDALSNIPLNQPQTLEALFPSSDPTLYISKIIKLLSESAPSSTSPSSLTEDFDSRSPSLLKLLIELYPLSPPQIQSFIKDSLLPPASERSQPLGRSDSLPSRLLKLAGSPTTTNTRILLQTLLYVVSDSDPVKFVQNVGYGHASGYLMMAGIPIPPEALETPVSSNNNNNDGSKEDDDKSYNPITGQYLSAEEEAIRASGIKGLEGMTDEEKEREAEKLFVLFERLNRTGVVNVENPLRTAVQEGRFEEITTDDEDSDEDQKGKGRA